MRRPSGSREPRQARASTSTRPDLSRLDLIVRWDGVAHVRMDALRRLNSPDALELFTVYHGQAGRGRRRGRLGEGRAPRSTWPTWPTAVSSPGT